MQGLQIVYILGTGFRAKKARESREKEREGKKKKKGGKKNSFLAPKIHSFFGSQSAQITEPKKGERGVKKTQKNKGAKKSENER